MTLLTFFPPTFVRSERGDSNGSNHLGFAYYWRYHPFAAAIAAQEVREARMKLPYAGAGIVVGAGAGAALLGFTLSASTFALWGLLIAMALSLRASFKRQLEIRGQGVECAVRERYYGTGLDTAIGEAARQLTRYPQFKGWPAERIAVALHTEQPIARKWMERNRGLVERAFKLQTGE